MARRDYYEILGAPRDADDAQLRASPDGLNSVVWTLWHLSRYEDLVVNLMLRGEPELFDERGGSIVHVDASSCGPGGFGHPMFSCGARKRSAPARRVCHELPTRMMREETPASNEAVTDNVSKI